MSPGAALGQELLDQLGSPKRSITARVDQILLDTEMDDETSVEQRMDIVIGERCCFVWPVECRWVTGRR
jgi:hypothetical protein